MAHLLRTFALAVLCLFSVVQAAETTGKPSVQVTIRNGSEQIPAAITVEASDAEGLDSLDISCPEADSTYHTQLSRSVIDRQFKRLFTLMELFPSISQLTTEIRLEVTVRNTRGAVASATVRVTPKNTHKGS